MEIRNSLKRMIVKEGKAMFRDEINMATLYLRSIERRVHTTEILTAAGASVLGLVASILWADARKAKDEAYLQQNKIEEYDREIEFLKDYVDRLTTTIETMQDKNSDTVAQLNAIRALQEQALQQEKERAEQAKAEEDTDTEDFEEADDGVLYKKEDSIEAEVEGPADLDPSDPVMG